MNIYTSQKLWNYLNPHFQVNLFDTLSKFNLNFWQISVLEPNFEQSERRLQRFCIRIDIVLWAERKLLDKPCECVNNMPNILSSQKDYLFDSGVSRFCDQILESASSFVEKTGQKVVAKVTMQKIFLLRFRSLGSALVKNLVHIWVDEGLWELFGSINSRLITRRRKYVPCFSIFGINFHSLFAMTDNVRIVFVAKFDPVNSMFGGLFILKLPKAKLLVAYAQQVRLNIIWLFQQVKQQLFGFVERFAINWTLIVEGIRDGNLNLGQIVDQLLLLFLDRVIDSTFTAHVSFFAQKFVLRLIQLLFELE